MDHTTQLEESPVSIDESPDETLLDEELLIEEISIDGMCGVY